MFEKGNKHGKGRPPIRLDKPELLLPIIFQKSRINWAWDFTELYKKIRRDEGTLADKAKFKMYLELMPYLCTKVNIKDLDSSKFVTEGDKQAMTDQTARLLEALENETGRPEQRKTPSVADGTPEVPPAA